MLISTAQRYRPFSHLPGVMVPIPGTSLAAKIYPVRIELYDLATNDLKLLEALDIPVTGPIAQFTTFLDLEKERVFVSGETSAGSLRYEIKHNGSCRSVVLASCKVNSCPLFEEGEASFTFPGEEWELSPTRSRLGMGVHKKQQIERVKERADLPEFLQLWWHIAQVMPVPAAEASTPTASLLNVWEEAIANRSPEKIADICKNLQKTAMEGIYCPRLNDREYQGIIPTGPVSGSPLWLLAQIGRLMRAMLVDDSKEGHLSLLPALPPELHCGRLLNISLKNLGSMDLEWTKKSIRRMILRTGSVTGPLQLHLSKSIRSFRLRMGEKEPGVIMKKGDTMELQPDTIYLLDTFVR